MSNSPAMQELINLLEAKSLETVKEFLDTQTPSSAAKASATVQLLRIVTEAASLGAK